jgi:hypothetical protein
LGHPFSLVECVPLLHAIVVNVAKEKAPDAFWVGRAFSQGKEGDALKEVQEVIKGNTALANCSAQHMLSKLVFQQKCSGITAYSFHVRAVEVSV